MIPARTRSRLPVRAPGLAIHRPRIRRASGILSPVRAGAMFVMVISALAVYGVANSAAFAYRSLAYEPATGALTGRDQVLAQLGVDGAPRNLFLLRTDALAASLQQLPAVLDAHVSVALPDTLAVSIVERTPVLVWNVNGHRYLVDRTGLLYAPAAAGGPGDGLAWVSDRRAASSKLDVGARVDPVDLDAATRMASLVPKDVGSAAKELRIVIDDKDGYQVRPIGVPWVAVFGIYTPTIRTPDLIPGQVRLLRSLLAGRELQVKRVVLADDRNGTYVSR